MALLNVQKASLTGLAPSFSAASVGGDTFVNDGKTVLHVKNGGASEITVMVNSQQPCNYGFDHDLQVAVPASGERIIGPFRQDRFNDANGQVVVTYSDTTSVTVAAIGQ